MASLSLLIAAENSEKIKTVVAFSPGEYLKGLDFASAIRALKISVFVTSSKKEIKDTIALLRFVNQEQITYHAPDGEGAHGSRVLWAVTPNHEEYWDAVLDFIKKV